MKAPGSDGGEALDTSTGRASDPPLREATRCPSADELPRLACLWVPLFPLAARLRSEPELRHEALVVMAGKGNAARVVAATRRARRAAIRPGMTLPQARTRLPQVIARPRDDECERAAQEALLDVAESFSPRVEDGEEGLALIDIEGLERHHPGEAPEIELGRALMLASEQRAGLPIRVGIASSKLAARLAAEQPHSPIVVPGGGEAEFLAPLPLVQLGPRARTLATLERWGIRSLGQLAALDEGEVQSRLGSTGQELHAIARGEDPRPLTPRQPPPTFREGHELEWPLVNLEPFLFIARSALERLARRMLGRGLACERLELSLALENEGHHERAITLPAPTRDVQTLTTLLRLDLEAHPPGGPVIAFVLTAHPDRPRRAQLSLFGPETLSPDRLATTVARLFALLGDGRVGSPRTVDGHRPERFALVPYEPPPPPPMRRSPCAGRGMLSVRVLRPPLPIEVVTGRSDPASPPATPPGSPRDTTAETTTGEAAMGDIPTVDHGTAPVDRARPLSVTPLAREEEAKRLRIEGKVRLASGPWELEEAWWGDDARQRDYWDVELEGGGLYRLYRDRRSDEWFADGVYD